MRARFLSLSLSTLLALLAPGLCASGDWRHFRGNDPASVSDETGVPTEFSPGAGIAWKAPLPGTGPSSPIVVSGRVIVTAASGPTQDRLHVLAFDAASGKPCWERQLWATGSTVCNAFGGIAAPTPASDGKRIFAFFGSNDLAAFDLDGNLQWFRGLTYESPHTRNEVGMASSPLVVGDTVIVQMENQGESFAAGIDATTGRTRWRIAREHEATWTSPILLRGKTPGENLVLLQSKSSLSAHEPRTGRELWRHAAPCSTLSSAACAGDRVYLPAGGGVVALAFDPQKRSVGVLWEEPRLRAENASPVCHEGRLYTVKSPGILVCGDAATGKVLWQVRLKGPIWATPVLAGGHAYLVNHEGLVQVVRLGTEGSLAGSGQIDGGILASPAVADGAIYFRSNRHLWKIARP
jgi:outer membrane protein assembly factor BamB